MYLRLIEQEILAGKDTTFKFAICRSYRNEFGAARYESQYLSSLRKSRLNDLNWRSLFWKKFLANLRKFGVSPDSNDYDLLQIRARILLIERGAIM